jgi:predicted ATPase/serine phosphatase RsbU (regulator of sigma subunit)
MALAQATSPSESFRPGQIISRDRGCTLICATRIADNRSVWLKYAEASQTSGASTLPDAWSELRHEAELTAVLRGEFFLKPVEVHETSAGPVLIFEPFAGLRLSDPGVASSFRHDLDILGFLQLAQAVTEALAALHGQRVIHKRLSPDAVFFDGESRAARLGNLGRASRVQGKSREIAGLSQEVSGLAYLAPEQTGRLNWAVGFGSDLYALGVIFYDLVTGRLPFTASDPLEWVHCHLARTPVPPAEVDARVPPSVSAIITRLLFKNPADRYLSASGLLADLRRAERDYAHALLDPVEPGLNGNPFARLFPLGEADHSEQFQLPERVYGRAADFVTLTAALDRARGGAAELVTVTGPPGSGKSSLVYEWYGASAGSTGGRGILFTAGKFEKFQRDQPYFGLNSAIQGLCRYLDCESEERRAEWKARLNAALGRVGRVMTDNFPALVRIMGEQPVVPDLPPAEARNRFTEAFRKLISALADPDNPLVLLLDDVQWADRSSLALIESLFTVPDRGGLLLILSFRDHEPTDLEDIEHTLADLESRGLSWTSIAAVPLSVGDVSSMLADAMGGASERYRPLSQIIREKTGGNPFFVRQILLQLAEEELIFYQDGWQWDESAIRQTRVTDNVVAFVADRIGRLPEAWRKLLEICSCFGSRIRGDLLPGLLNQTQRETASAQEGALASGALLLRAGDYAFVHDRVREAAQSLIPAGRIPTIHLAIAQALLNQPEAQIEEDLFDVVHHLGLASPLIVDSTLRLRSRELNLRAARRARNAAAYGPALGYAHAASPDLSDPLWDTDYAFCASSALVLSECLFFNQQHDEFERLNNALLQRLRTAEHIVPLRRMMILALSASSRHQEAVASTEQALDYLGAPFPGDLPSTFAALGEETALINSLIAGQDEAGGMEALHFLPPLKDSRIEAIISILVSITPDTVMLGLGALYALAVTRAVRLSIEHGYSALVPVVFANYSVVVHQTTGDVSTAYQWAQLAADLDEKHGGALHAPANFIPAWLVTAWKLPASSQIGVFESACRAGLEQGDILFGCFSAAGLTVFTAWSGVPLSEVVSVADRYRVIIRGRVYSADYHCLLEKQFALALMGLTQGRTSLADSHVTLSELEAVRETRSAHQIGYLLLFRLRLAYLFGEFDEALRWQAQLESYAAGIAGLLIQADYAFYHALTLLELAGASDDDSLKIVEEHLARLRTWARDCPQNFLAYQLIVEAELARVKGHLSEACAGLAKAVAAADAFHLVHHAALACELGIRAQLTLGDPIAARAYLHEALSRYQRWGAVTKVMDLTERFRDLHASEGSASPSPRLEDSLRPQSLDLLSLMKSAEAISGEIVMSRLIERMMRTLIENACAEWGALVLVEGGTLTLKSIQRASGSSPIELLDQPIDQPTASTDILPRSILHFVASTREPLVLSDARRAREFAADPVIQRTHCRSVLCAPILQKGALSGLIYLENSLTSGAFTPDRLEFLRLLSSQIAVSLENARYHERTLEWERLQRDLDAARAIQLSLLPQKMPDSANYLLAVRSSTCYEVGGDYTDVIPLSTGSWVMVVADVAGKGLASAMIASSFRSAFRAIAATGIPLHELANRIGELHWSDGDEVGHRYVTAAILRLDLSTNTLEVVNAGHNPILLIYAGGARRLFTASAPPLGILPGLRYTTEQVDFPPGARLLAFTDGLTEVNRGDEEFGEERLFSSFSNLPFDSANTVLESLWAELAEFSSEPRQSDDMTALVLGRLDNPTPDLELRSISSTGDIHGQSD